MKVMKYFVLASLLCLSACGDDNDNKNNEGYSVNSIKLAN